MKHPPTATGLGPSKVVQGLREASRQAACAIDVFVGIPLGPAQIASPPQTSRNHNQLDADSWGTVPTLHRCDKMRFGFIR